VKENPIPFKAETVRAILEGRKTQTRWVIKPIGIYSACYALEDIGEIYGMKCTCGRGFDCPIHKRESGYLSRLHKRYSRVLKLAFDAQLNEVKDESR